MDLSAAASTAYAQCCTSPTPVVFLVFLDTCLQVDNIQLHDSSAGALLVHNSATSVTNSSFAGLHHNDSAIDIQNTEGGSFSISQCMFSNLTISQDGIYGAALYLESPSIAITSCTFFSCSVLAGEGGAI